MNNSSFFESELQKCSTKGGRGINIIEEKKWKGEVLIPIAGNLSDNEWFGDSSCWFWPFQSSEDKL